MKENTIMIGAIQSAFSIGGPSTGELLTLGEGLTGEFNELAKGLSFLWLQRNIAQFTHEELEQKVRRQVPEAGRCPHRLPFDGQTMVVQVTTRGETRELVLPVAGCNLRDSDAGMSTKRGRICGRVCHQSHCADSPQFTTGGY